MEKRRPGPFFVFVATSLEEERYLRGHDSIEGCFDRLSSKLEGRDE